MSELLAPVLSRDPPLPFIPQRPPPHPPSHPPPEPVSSHIAAAVSDEASYPAKPCSSPRGGLSPARTPSRHFLPLSLSLLLIPILILTKCVFKVAQRSRRMTYTRRPTTSLLIPFPPPSAGFYFLPRAIRGPSSCRFNLILPSPAFAGSASHKGHGPVPSPTSLSSAKPTSGLCLFWSQAQISLLKSKPGVRVNRHHSRFVVDSQKKKL